MVPFKETINTKQELIEACKKGFEDYSNRRISKNDFCMYFGFTHGEAITKFYEGNYEQLLIDGGFNSGSGAYFSGGINAWKNLRDGKYVFPPLIQNVPISNTMVPYPIQKIYYGCPGSGKSHKVKEITNTIDPNYVFRTTFHPDTDYASFVGYYKPSTICANIPLSTLEDLQAEFGKIDFTNDKVRKRIEFVAQHAESFINLAKLKNVSYNKIINQVLSPESNGLDTYYAIFVEQIAEEKAKNTISITYKFCPQVFTNAYVKAWEDTSKPVYLIIEEINRGNCAQIFGDLFQLLDRRNGVSEYPVKADKDLADYLKTVLGADHEGIKNGELCLPPNLIIYTTMNTSDQSLYPMDSAFKRRWDWEYVPINYSKDIDSGKFIIEIDEDTKYSWVAFLESVNEKIYDATNSEDKQMGNFFIKKSIKANEFVNKVMFYLWNEVCKEEYGTQRNFFRKGKEGKTEFKFTELFGDNQATILKEFMTSLGIEPIGKKPEEPAAE